MYRYKFFKAKNRNNFVENDLLLFIPNYAIPNLSYQSFY